jgi:hypothetical protein
MMAVQIALPNDAFPASPNLSVRIMKLVGALVTVVAAVAAVATARS